MAHKSRKKHLKHARRQDPDAAPPRARKHAGAKAEIEVDRLAARDVKADKPRTAKTAKTVATGQTVQASKNGKATKSAQPAKKRGIVGKVADKVAEKITARPKRVLKRVKSLLGV